MSGERLFNIMVCTSAEFEAKRAHEVNMMASLLETYLKGIGESGDRLDEMSGSLRCLLDAWWSERHVSIEAVDPDGKILREIELQKQG